MKTAETQVHPTAVVSPEAELGTGVRIDAYAVIAARVVVGDRTYIGPQTVISGPSTIGSGNRFYGQAAIGTDPQDLKYHGEESFLEIGDDNLIREFVTVNRGTEGGGLKTIIGKGNLLMTGVHIAHDCIVANGTILANSATLAGHVSVGDGATIGAFSGVHQFCRVGRHGFIGGYTVVTRDALPFVKTVGVRSEAQTFGINSVGLERRGFLPGQILALKRAYRLLIQKGLPAREAAAVLQKAGGMTEEVQYLINFIQSAERGFIR